MPNPPVPRQYIPDGVKGTPNVPAPDQVTPGTGGGFDPYAVLLRELGEIKGMLNSTLPTHANKLLDLDSEVTKHGDKIEANGLAIALLRQEVESQGRTISSQSKVFQQAVDAQAQAFQKYQDAQLATAPRRWQQVGAWAGALSSLVALAAFIVALLK